MSSVTSPRIAAQKAKRHGILVPQPCENCGVGDVQMHHEDHFRPLDIKWLCQTCHTAAHTAEPGPELTAQIEMRRLGRRKRVMHGKTLCSRCYINPPQASHKYCKPCKNADNKSRRARNKAALEAVAIQAKAGT